MDSPKKLTVNIMAPGKPSCWALWWWIWAFSSGIILGCTIAWVHNKVSAIELPRRAVDVRRRQADAGGDDAGGYLLRHRLYLGFGPL